MPQRSDSPAPPAPKIENPFLPSDLLVRAKRWLDTYWCQPDGADDAYTYTTDDDHTGRDNWAVWTFVEITAPDGTKHRLKVTIEETGR